MFLLVLLILLGMIGIYIFIRRKVTNHIPSSFPNKEKRKSLDPNKRTVVCFGDSNTHGNVSYDWVSDLSVELSTFQVLNAGLNSDLSFSLLKRLEDVILCKPDFITIMIGTNDINASYSDKSLKRYVSLGKILSTESPSIISFEKNIKEIVKKFQQETNAKIALITLPLMGEDLNYKINQIADNYSLSIEKVANQSNISCLQIRQEQKEYLLKNPSFTPYKFEQYFVLLNKSVIFHYIFGLSWDKISKKHKTQLSPDFLHQNSIAGKMIKDQILNWIKK